MAHRLAALTGGATHVTPRRPAPATTRPDGPDEDPAAATPGPWRERRWRATGAGAGPVPHAVGTVPPRHVAARPAAPADAAPWPDRPSSATTATGTGWTPRADGPRPVGGSDGDHAHRPAPVDPRGGASAATAARPATVDALADAARRVGPPSGDVPGPPPGRVRWAVAPRVAAVAALAVVLLAGGVALRASTAPQGAPVELPRPRASAGADGARAADAPAATPDASAPTAVVHVVGAVGAPGVVTLPADARVADALAAAGGSTPDADLTAVNLARTVVDGEQLRVPRAGEVVAAPPPPAGGADPGAAPGAGTGPVGGAVDLNTADLAALDSLPGVGPVLAQRILDRRAEAPFTSVDELDDVSGIGPAVLERLRPWVRV